MVDKVNDILPIIQYTASAGQTVFPYPFPVFASGDIVVTVDSVAKSEGTDYTVSGVDAEDGGDITFTSGLSAGNIVTIYRDMAFDRLTDYQQNGDFLSETINEDFDRVVFMVQQLNEVDARSLKFAPEDTGKTTTIDTSQKSKLFGLDENGNLFYYSASSDVETDYKTYSDLSSVIADTSLVLNDRGRIQGVGDFEIVSTNPSGYYRELTKGSLYVKPKTSHLSLYGAVGDGIVDDTTAINNALADAALNNEYLIGDPLATYNFSIISVKNGIKGFEAKGVLKPDNSTVGDTDGAIRFDGLKFATTKVQDATFKLIIDTSNGTQTGIFANDCENCDFKECYISGFLDNLTVNHYGILFWYGAKDNKVHDNYIEGVNNPTQRGLLIDLVGDGDDFGNFFVGGAITRATTPCTGNLVYSNTLVNGSYAVNVLASEYNVVIGNYCYNQDHRSIYLANSWYNVIANNQCLEYLSSGVVLAYGCSHNIISNNNFQRVVYAAGEASININTGSKYNLSYNNKIDAGANYGIYMATDAVGNVAKGNEIKNYYQAAVAIENDWISPKPTNAFYSRPNYAAPPIGTQWSFVDCTDNVVQDNDILEAYTGRNVCGIYVAQIDAGGLTATRNNTIKGNNVLTGSRINYDFFIYADDESKLSGLNVKDNNFRSDNLRASFTTTGATTWNDKISRYGGNEYLDRLINSEAVAFADGDTTPSVLSNTDDSAVKLFTCANTGATSITNFDDGFDGQEFMLRGDANTTIVYGSTTIRTKGNVDITGMTTNVFVRFRKIGSIWYEVFRSF